MRCLFVSFVVVPPYNHTFSCAMGQEYSRVPDTAVQGDEIVVRFAFAQVLACCRLCVLRCVLSFCFGNCRGSLDPLHRLMLSIFMPKYWIISFCRRRYPSASLFQPTMYFQLAERRPSPRRRSLCVRHTACARRRKALSST